jgi:hypothetical protein
MARQIDHQRDAEFLAAILDHEEMPAEVSEYIMGVVLELAGNVNICTPEVLRVAWPLIMAQYEYTDAALMMPLWIAIRELAGDDGNEVIDAISAARREPEAHGHVSAHLTDEWPDVIAVEGAHDG